MEKINLVLTLAILSVLVLMSFASAAIVVNFVGPANNSAVGQNSDFNVTINMSCATDGYCGEGVNVTWYMKSASTGNSSWTAVTSNLNANFTTTNKSGIIANTSLIEDSNDYYVNVTVVNSTGTFLFGTMVNTGIRVDNGVPTAPTLSPATNTLKTTAGGVTFTGTVSDRNTTSCTYTIYRGGNPSDGTSGTGTYSGTSCTFTKDFGNVTTPTSDNGNWFWTITASDGSNTTSSTANVYQVNIPPTGGSSGGTIPSMPTSTVGTGMTSQTEGILWIIGIVVGVIVVIVIIRRLRQ